MNHLEASRSHVKYVLAVMSPEEEHDYETHISSCDEPSCIRQVKEFDDEGDWERRVQVVVSDEIIQKLKEQNYGSSKTKNSMSPR